MRVLFCGSGNFAVPALQAILATEHEVAAIITQPARPAGRGGKLRPTPVAEWAAQHGLAAAECENVNAPEMHAEVQRLAPDAIFVADFGQFLSQNVCRLARLCAFNLHGSLLPELRGAAPVNWAIIRGLRHTGVTTFALVDRMDAGPIYLREGLDISPSETAEELRARLAELGATVVCRTLGLLAGGWAHGEEQDETKASYAPRLKKTDGHVDFSADAETVRNLVHGSWPWPGAQAVYRRHDGKEIPVTLGRATAHAGEAGGEPGVLDADLLVATGRGRLAVERIQPAGKRLMEWRDFVNGYRVCAGDQLLKVKHDVL